MAGRGRCWLRESSRGLVPVEVMLSWIQATLEGMPTFERGFRCIIERNGNSSGMEVQ